MTEQMELIKEDFHPDILPMAWQNIAFRWPVSGEYMIEEDKDDNSEYIFELFAKDKELYNPFHRPEAFLMFARLGDSEPDSIPLNNDILHFTRTYGDIFFGTHRKPRNDDDYKFFLKPRVGLSDKFPPGDERSLHYQIFKSDKPLSHLSRDGKKLDPNEEIWLRTAKIKAFCREVAIAKKALHLYEALRFPGPHMCDKLKDALLFFLKNADSIGLSYNPINPSVDDILLIFDEKTKIFFWSRTNSERTSVPSSLSKSDYIQRDGRVWYNATTTIALWFLKDIISFKKDWATNGTTRRRSPVHEEFAYAKTLLPRYSTPDNLLQAMWNVFFLKVSGQMEYVYKVCEGCGGIILPEKDGKKLGPKEQTEMRVRGEKIRGFNKNRRVCDRCPQNNRYNSVNKPAWEYHKAGYSNAEIARLIGCSEEKVMKAIAADQAKRSRRAIKKGKEENSQ